MSGLAIDHWPNPTTRHTPTYDTLSPYLDVAWLPIIGPTSTLLLRRLTTDLRHNGPHTTNTDDLAASLGIKPGTGSRYAQLPSALRRLNQFALIQYDHTAATAHIRGTIPRLSRNQLNRLPPAINQRIRRCETLLAHEGAA